MYKKNRIGIIIPAHNEQDFIIKTIQGLPSYIDEYIVIDDGSTDQTSQRVKAMALKNKKIVLLKNTRNCGLGYTVKRGFLYFIEHKSVDIVCITAADNQFEGRYLTPMIENIINNKCDYAKSNRFLDQYSLNKMPTHRLFGNIVFTLLTKLASGYYTIFDTLNAFSATKLSTIQKMNMRELKNRFDFEISYLMQHAYLNARVKDFFTPVKYDTEISDVNYITFIFQALSVLTLGFLRRINRKYVMYNFHPIALFFYSGGIMLFFGIAMGVYITFHSFGPRPATTATVMLSVVPFILGIQFILQAIVLDIQNEPR